MTEFLPAPSRGPATTLEDALARLHEIEILYEARCAATVFNFTDGEEMFLADLSMILNGETDAPGT